MCDDSYTILVVDDERTPMRKDTDLNVEIARTTEEAIARLDQGGVNELWLDYSLGPGQDIHDLLRWINANQPDLEYVAAHSLSYEGRRLIKSVLADGGYDVKIDQELLEEY